MAKVLFKKRFFIEGYQFAEGVGEVPDRFLDRLPLGSEVLDEKKAKELEKAKADTGQPEPMTLSQHRRGAKNARPLGKQEAPK